MMKATFAQRPGATLIVLVSLFATVSGFAQAPQALPKPVLYLVRHEFLTVNDKQFTQYNFDVD